MTLQKSKKTAFLLGLMVSVIMVAIVFGVEGLWFGFAGYSENELIGGTASGGVPGILVLLAAASATTLFQAGIAAVVIYQLNDAHYGPGGAVRWAVFAVAMAALIVSLRRFLPDTGSPSMDLVRDGIGIAGILFSYWFSFRCIPRKSARDGGEPPAE